MKLHLINTRNDIEKQKDETSTQDNKLNISEAMMITLSVQF